MRTPIVDWPEIIRLGLSASASPVGPTSPVEVRLAAVRRTLDRHFVEPWTVPELADRAGL